MRFLKPLLGFTWLDLTFVNRLNLNNQIEDIRLYQKCWLDRLERMDRGRLSKIDLEYVLRGDRTTAQAVIRWLLTAAVQV